MSNLPNDDLYQQLWAQGNSFYDLCLCAYHEEDAPDYDAILTAIAPDATENIERIVRMFRQRPFVQHYDEYRACQKQGSGFAALYKRLRNDERFSASEARELLMKLFDLTAHEWLQLRKATDLATATGIMRQIKIDRHPPPQTTPESDDTTDTDA